MSDDERGEAADLRADEHERLKENREMILKKLQIMRLLLNEIEALAKETNWMHTENQLSVNE